MELHDLATGPVSPTAAMIFATLGSVLGVLLVTQARRRTGVRRVRLVAYAALAVALPAVWLPGLIAVLALRVDGSVLRLDPGPLGYSLGVATGAAVLALLPVCSGRPGPVRQVLAGLCLVGAIGGTGGFLAAALTTGAPIVAHPTSIGIAVAIACVTGFGLAAALGATRTLRKAMGNGVLLGLGLAGVYHVAAAALRVQPGPGGPAPADDVAGLSPQQIGLPGVIAAAVVVALIWYFTLGTATVRDLRLLFEAGSDTEQIEPWMVEQVRSRVALSSTAYAPLAGWPEIWSRNEPTVAVHAIQVERGIADAFARPLPGRTRPELTAAEDPTLAPDAVAGDAPAAAGTDTTDLPAVTDTPPPTWPPMPVDPAPDASPAAVADDPAPPAWPEREDTPGMWRQVPDWGLPTSQWSRAEFDEATRVDDEAGLRAEDWPTPGRNEPGVARRVGSPVENSRYGPLPGPPLWPMSMAPDPSPVAGQNEADWIARLRAAASRAAAQGNGAGEVIVREYEAAPLPRRNARPISRP